MKITDNATYLRVALNALQSKITPELTSSDGQGAAAMLAQVLGEVLGCDAARIAELDRAGAFGTRGIGAAAGGAPRGTAGR